MAEEKKNEPGLFSQQLLDFRELNSYIEEKIANRLKEMPDDPYESKSTKEINTSLSLAQGAYPQIGLNKENPYFKNKYADMNSILKAIRPILSKNGLSVTQQTVLTKEGSTVLKTRVRHTSGEWIETRARVLPTKADAQSYASALTYMKRYSLMALLCLTTSDDASDDDAETVMYDTREARAKGVALNTKYNPREQSSEVITKEQLEELEYELGSYDDIADQVLSGLKIQSLADMPKNKYQASITRIRSIKNARDGLD